MHAGMPWARRRGAARAAAGRTAAGGAAGQGRQQRGRGAGGAPCAAVRGPCRAVVLLDPVLPIFTHNGMAELLPVIRDEGGAAPIVSARATPPYYQPLRYGEGMGSVAQAATLLEGPCACTDGLGVWAARVRGRAGQGARSAMMMQLTSQPSMQTQSTLKP